MHLDSTDLRPSITATVPAGHAAPWRFGWLLWVGGLLLLCVGLGAAAVSRSQEARVLETAREMLGSEWHNWLVPRVNGHIRLQKPPLAYWLAALSYQVFGVGEGAGRVPAAVAGWLTVGVTGVAGAWLFGRRAGLFSGAALLGSYLFFRHSRLAETDVLATLLATTAVYALWRGYRIAADEVAPGRSALWFHFGAVAIGLTVVAKGPPAAYPPLFFVALASFERRWKPLRRFVLCGAPLTAAIIALPWFVYVGRDPSFGQLTGDLRNSAGGGRGHAGLFFNYIPDLFIATAPWSALWIVALVAAARRWKGDARLRGVVVWVGSILLPLFVWRNKQIHYLMPVMPPLMILVGWLLEESLKPAPPGADPVLGKLARRLVAATAVVLALAAPGVLVAANLARGRVIGADLAAAGLLLAVLGGVAYLYRVRGPAAGISAFVIGNAVMLAALAGFWAASLKSATLRAIPPALAARYGDGPYALVGREDLPLVFYMRRVLPVAKTNDEVAALGARTPAVVAIEPLGDTRRARSAVVEEQRFVDNETTYRVGRINPSALTTQPAAPPDVRERPEE